MKNFKKADIIISIVLMIGITICSFVAGVVGLLMGYFVIGGWQLISMLVHAVNGWHMEKGGSRSVYHRIVIWLAISVVLIILFKLYPLLLALLFLMMVVAPIMAIYYTCLCYSEYKKRVIDDEDRNENAIHFLQ